MCTAVDWGKTEPFLMHSTHPLLPGLSVTVLNFDFSEAFLGSLT